MPHYLPKFLSLCHVLGAALSVNDININSMTETWNYLWLLPLLNFLHSSNDQVLSILSHKYFLSCGLLSVPTAQVSFKQLSSLTCANAIAFLPSQSPCLQSLSPTSPPLPTYLNAMLHNVITKIFLKLKSEVTFLFITYIFLYKKMNILIWI